VNTPLTEQIRAYFNDVDRQQGAVDVGALRRGVEEGEVITVEVSQVDEPLADAPISSHRWPLVIAAAAVVILVVVGALVVSWVRDTQENERAAAPPVANGLIAFGGESDANPETSDIYVAAPDGTGLRPLTSTPELIEYAPAWSPDGSRLAFVRNHDHISSTPCLNGCQLVVIDPATGVETFSADIPPPPRPGFDTWTPWSLAWSPDGREIAVQSVACGEGGCGTSVSDPSAATPAEACAPSGCGGTNSVFADLETGTFTTFTPPYRATWSPDGEWLTLTQDPIVPGPSMLLVPADLIGTGDIVDVAQLPQIRELPERPGDLEWGSADWTPDGSALLVSDGTQIDVVTIADGERRSLIEDGSDPVVSPDGTQIAYQRGDGDLHEIWVAAADGSNPRLVTASLTQPAWSPDGTLLLAEDYQGEFTVRPDGTDRTTLGIRDHAPKFPMWPGSGIDWQPARAHEQ
jgi:dipeptidyl aminopeptidase/acylaminoacyl peptidase